jgi:glucose-1-phosphate adenylyltransferase
MPGEAAGWFQGTADAVRKFIWVLEVNNPILIMLLVSYDFFLGVTAKEMHSMLFIFMQDYYKHKNIEHILILSGDQLYRMDYMELVQVGDILY